MGDPASSADTVAFERSKQANRDFYIIPGITPESFFLNTFYTGYSGDVESTCYVTLYI